MKYAYFPGCKIAHHLPEHGQSTRAVCSRLGIDLVTPEFGCCGYPVRHESMDAAFFSALRNLAMAQTMGLDLLTPCKCCFGNFQHALHRIRIDEKFMLRMKNVLRQEGLEMPLNVRVWHLLQVLDQGLGGDALSRAVVRPLRSLRIACHYGCHALRPEAITHFDDPFAPTLFERLVSSLGATSVTWELRLECCGYPLRGRDERISDLLMAKKLASAKASGADILTTGCTYCQLQFGRENERNPETIPAVLFTQVAGLALGCTPAELGVGVRASLLRFMI